MAFKIYLLVFAILINLGDCEAQSQNFKTPFSCTLSCGDATSYTDARNDGYKVKKSSTTDQGK